MSKRRVFQTNKTAILDALAITHFCPCVINPQTNHVRLGFTADQIISINISVFAVQSTDYNISSEICSLKTLNKQIDSGSGNSLENNGNQTQYTWKEML